MVKQYSQNINTTNFIPDHNICQWWATILQEGSHKNPKSRDMGHVSYVTIVEVIQFSAMLH
jgi:hypothetical protein